MKEAGMLNYLWGFMIAIGVLYGGVCGKMPEITSAALSSAQEAVTLCVTMAGVMALWMGLMEIAEKSGLIKAATRWIQPFICFMFPRIPEKHPARKYITMNVIANIFGLGWAATPAGLKAMEALAELEAERGNPEYLPEGGALWEPRMGSGKLMDGGAKTAAKSAGISSSTVAGAKTRAASNEMCIFLILNISSLQLIPVNMIAYRQQYGSVNPAGIIAPSILATAVSTGVAVVYCKWKGRRE